MHLFGMLRHGRVQPRHVALLEVPALLSPQASGKGSVGDNTSVQSFYMRGLWLRLPRSSHGGHHFLLFSRGREPHPWPGFRAFS
eukprot:4550242-Amphidinium_carterae.1